MSHCSEKCSPLAVSGCVVTDEAKQLETLNRNTGLRKGLRGIAAGDGNRRWFLTDAGGQRSV